MVHDHSALQPGCINLIVLVVVLPVVPVQAVDEVAIELVLFELFSGIDSRPGAMPLLPMRVNELQIRLISKFLGQCTAILIFSDERDICRYHALVCLHFWHSQETGWHDDEQITISVLAPGNVLVHDRMQLRLLQIGRAHV